MLKKAIKELPDKITIDYMVHNDLESLWFHARTELDLIEENQQSALILSKKEKTKLKKWVDKYEKQI